MGYKRQGRLNTEIALACLAILLVTYYWRADLIAEASKANYSLSRQEGETETLTSKHVFIALAVVFFLNLLLRVFYLRYDFVNGDEAVRALTASRLLEGARLYRDVVTDKPPCTTLFYAAVLALFGPVMTAVHLAAMVWNFTTSIFVYLTAAHLYNKRVGLWAALLFVYFSTNYLTQDMMAANTEQLMALPLTVSFYFFVKGRRSFEQTDRAAITSLRTIAALLAAGFLTGVATLFKQVGIFNLVFFAAYEAFAGGLLRGARHTLLRLLYIALGFAAAMALFISWLAATDALSDFWRNVVVLNMFYVGSIPAGLWLKYFVGRGLGYVLFNAPLWSLALWTVVKAIKRSSRQEFEYNGRSTQSRISNRSDFAVALWGAASLTAVLPGGRFFGHYFIQVLPALSILAARGVKLLEERLKRPAERRKARVAVAALALLALFGLVRFHGRTAVLAYEALTGTRTRWSEAWGMTEREREAEVVSQFVRSRAARGEPLYIWDYALDVYWQTGCRPASRYLTPYYITGQFTDAPPIPSVSSEEFWRQSRTYLIEDLRRSRPRLILDVSGAIESLPYTEIVEFIKEEYSYEGEILPNQSRPFVVYRLKY